MTPIEAIETLLNGNITDFRNWLKHANKKAILGAIQHYSIMTGHYGIIEKMLDWL